MAKNTQEYKGHRIRIPAEVEGDQSYIEQRGTLFIDAVPIRFGQDVGGGFYLEPYAYDRHASLFEVVKRFIDYRERSKATAPKRTRASAMRTLRRPSFLGIASSIVFSRISSAPMTRASRYPTGIGRWTIPPARVSGIPVSWAALTAPGDWDARSVAVCPPHKMCRTRWMPQTSRIF